MPQGTAMPVFSSEPVRLAPSCVQVRGAVRATPPPERREMDVSAWSYKRGNRFQEHAHWVPLARVLGIVPRDWDGKDYYPVAPEAPKVSGREPARKSPGEVRSQTYRYATMAHLDLDHLSYGDLRQIVNATIKRVGERKWRHAGAHSRAVHIATTVDAPFTVSI